MPIKGKIYSPFSKVTPGKIDSPFSKVTLKALSALDINYLSKAISDAATADELLVFLVNFDQGFAERLT
jgi:phage FluMu protein gp41